MSLEPTNQDRAEWAEVGLRAFAETVYHDVESEWDECALGDLLADLMHLADREGWDFHKRLESATTHYRIESALDGEVSS